MPRKASNSKSLAIPSEQYWPHHLFVPEPVSQIRSFLAAQGWTERQINEHQDKVAYFLHRLVTAPIFNKNYKLGDYLPIGYEALIELYGNQRSVALVLKMLQTSGIIESDRKKLYGKCGSKSYGYRLTEQAQGKAVGLMVFNQQEMGRKLAQHKQLQEAGMGNNRFLKRIYRDFGKVRIHQASALAYLQKVSNKTKSFIETQGKALDSPTFSPKVYKALLREADNTSKYIVLPPIVRLSSSLKKKRKKAKENGQDPSMITAYQMLLTSVQTSFNANLAAIDAIHTQDFKVPTRPIKGSRVYTSLTNLASPLRRFLYHAQHPDTKLVNLDIRNSQPFLLCLLLLKKYEGSSLPEDVARYIRQTSTGMFYEDTQKDMLGKDALEHMTKRERKVFKSWFFGNVFFCENRHMNGKAGKYLQEHYKNVFKVIQQYKGGDHRHLALAMQKEEASVMLDSVVKTLHGRKIWNLSIHDSIVCLENDEQTVKAVILDAFRQKCGIIPTVEPENLDGSIRKDERKTEASKEHPAVSMWNGDPDDYWLFEDTKYNTELDFDDEDMPVIRHLPVARL